MTSSHISSNTQKVIHVKSVFCRSVCFGKTKKVERNLSRRRNAISSQDKQHFFICSRHEIKWKKSDESSNGYTQRILVIFTLDCHWTQCWGFLIERLTQNSQTPFNPNKESVFNSDFRSGKLQKRLNSNPGPSVLQPVLTSVSFAQVCLKGQSRSLRQLVADSP